MHIYIYSCNVQIALMQKLQTGHTMWPEFIASVVCIIASVVCIIAMPHPGVPPGLKSVQVVVN